MRIIAWKDRPQRNGTKSSVTALKFEYTKQRQAAVPNTLLSGGNGQRCSREKQDFASLTMLFLTVLLSFIRSFWGIFLCVFSGLTAECNIKSYYYHTSLQIATIQKYLSWLRNWLTFKRQVFRNTLNFFRAFQGGFLVLGYLVSCNQGIMPDLEQHFLVLTLPLLFGASGNTQQIY